MDRVKRGGCVRSEVDREKEGEMSEERAGWREEGRDE